MTVHREVYEWGPEEGSIFLEHRITSTGLELSALSSAEAEDVLLEFYEDRDADSEHEEGHTGNAAMPDEYRYHYIVVAIYPRKTFI